MAFATADPEAKWLRRVTLVIQIGIGFTNGIFLSVLGPFFYDRLSLSAGVSVALTVTMVLFAFRQGMVALLEIPTGALADTIGRGHTVVLALIVRAGLFMSLAAMVFCHTVVPMIFWASLASICHAVGYSLFNGAFSAWVADRLREKAPTVPYALLSSRFSYYQSVGSICGCFISIVLYLNQLPFVAFSLGAISTYIMMGFAITRMREPQIISQNIGRHRTAGTVLKEMRRRISEGYHVVRERPVITWLVMVYGSYMFLMTLVTYLWPVYLRASEATADIARNWLLISMITEAMYFSGARLFVLMNDHLTKHNRGNLVRFVTYRRAMTLTTILSALSVFVMSYLAYHGNIPFVVLVVAVSVVIFCTGWVMSCFDILVNSFVPVNRAQDRSTILSTGSMCRSIIAVVLAIPAGGVSAKESPVGWAIPAALLLISAVVSFFLLKSDEFKRVAPSVAVKGQEAASASS